MAHPFVEENKQAREKLRDLIRQLQDHDLAHRLNAQWTVGSVLGHLAFWDYRAHILIQRWKKTKVEPSPADVHVINDAMLPLLLAIPPRKAAETALEAAAAIDHEIEGLDENLISEIQTAAGPFFRLNRASHRKDHISQIEKALGE